MKRVLLLSEDEDRESDDVFLASPFGDLPALSSLQHRGLPERRARRQSYLYATGGDGLVKQVGLLMSPESDQQGKRVKQEEGTTKGGMKRKRVQSDLRMRHDVLPDGNNNETVIELNTKVPTLSALPRPLLGKMKSKMALLRRFKQMSVNPANVREKAKSVRQLFRKSVVQKYVL